MTGNSTRGLMGRLSRLGAVAVGTALLATACGSGGSGSTVTLTLWQNYGTESNATATTNLINAFEKLHPDIHINDVAQPADNYFALLQAAAISKTGPDLAVMWTGLFTLQYDSYSTEPEVVHPAERPLRHAGDAVGGPGIQHG